MKAKLVGKQYLDFEPTGGGDRVIGTKLHLVGVTSETSPDMSGQRVASIFVRFPVDDLKLGGTIELVYEQTLGSSKPRLMSVVNCAS